MGSKLDGRALKITDELEAQNDFLSQTSKILSRALIRFVYEKI